MADNGATNLREVTVSDPGASPSVQNVNRHLIAGRSAAARAREKSRAFSLPTADSLAAVTVTEIVPSRNECVTTRRVSTKSIRGRFPKLNPGPRGRTPIGRTWKPAEAAEVNANIVNTKVRGSTYHVRLEGVTGDASQRTGASRGDR
jgi:hypothetical protein